MRAIKVVLVLALSIGIVFMSVPNLYADETSEIILRLLVKKGIVTQEEVDGLRAEIRKAERREKKEIVTVERRPEDFRVYWKEGLRLKTEDEKFSLKLGGRAYVDAGYKTSDADIDAASGENDTEAEFRATRLYASGTIYDDFIYKVQLDFAGGDADFKDVYVGMNGLPYVGTLKVGHFKEPFGLEELTSSRFITFMERALPNAFTPGRNVGLGVYSTALDKRVTWAAGIFRDADSFGNVTSYENDYTARITGLPWYEDKDKLVHLGIAYSLRDSDDNISYSTTPEAHIAPTYANTGTITAELAHLVGYEAALLYGPFSLQGEYIQSIIDETDGSSNRFFQGAYTQASYFLTGEHRNYSKSSGAFSRVKPIKNFSWKDKTFGAWEMATRYSYLDLSDEEVLGGIMHDVSVGLNWYLNPNMRIMANYIHSYLDGGPIDGDANGDIFLTRFQVDF